MKKITLTLFLFIGIITARLSAQNVGINATGSTPDASAMLDVSATNKGVLIPRVSLSSTTDVSTISTPATGLMVYNINASMTNGNGVGFYYNAGTTTAASWVKVLNSANNPVSVSLASDYTVSTAAYADVTGMSVTFTATKSTALVQFTCSGYAYTNSMAFVSFRIYNTTSSTSIGGSYTHMQNYDNRDGTVTPWNCSFSKNMSGLTPGNNYTIKVQASRDGILGTYDGIINASSTPDTHHMTLTVHP